MRKIKQVIYQVRHAGYISQHYPIVTALLQAGYRV